MPNVIQNADLIDRLYFEVMQTKAGKPPRSSTATISITPPLCGSCSTGPPRPCTYMRLVS